MDVLLHVSGTLVFMKKNVSNAFIFSCIWTIKTLVYIHLENIFSAEI